MSESNVQICSILKASLYTYNIEPQNSTLAQDVGFINTPKSFTAGLFKAEPFQNHACYVGETTDHIILAFRGTALKSEDKTQSKLDWINNFIAKPVEQDGIPGKLHKGFSHSVERLWDKGFPAEVEKRMAGGKSLIVTGYSKGAALAPIAAAFLNKRLNIKADRMAIYIFEPPRPGDETFAEYVNQTFPTTLRYEYQDDIVPHLPPMKWLLNLLSLKFPLTNKILEKFTDIDEWNYKSVGNLKFVNWENKIVDYPLSQPLKLKELWCQRLEHLINLVPNHDIKKIWLDHIPQKHLYPVLCGESYPQSEELQLETFGINESVF